MGKIAFVFSGQGSQYPGMGQSLCAASPAAAAVFDAAERIRPGTKAQCFSGTLEELSVTKNTQPCLFCVDLAAAEALREAGVTPDCVAGFSLGEVAAVTFAGMFSVEEGLSLVTKRGEAMQKAAEAVPSAMAAVLKLPNETVEALAARFDGVYPVNYNCPGQLVVAAKKETMPAFLEAVQGAGGRAVPLNVSGGFHSPFMTEAAKAFGMALADVAPKPVQMPVYANYTAEPYTPGEERQLLQSQIENPVRWQQTVERMIEAGVDTFFEVGAGKTLSGLIRKIDRTLRVYNVENAETLAAAVQMAREMA